MSLEFGNGQVIEVVPPALPVVSAAPPSSPPVVVVPVIGPQGPPGTDHGAEGQIRLTAIASVALSGHRVVTRRSDDDTLEYASNLVAGHLHAPLWITLGAAAAGAPAEVLIYGTLHEPSWAWVPGPLYLGANGLLTQAAPAAPGALFLAQIGVATAPTSVFIDRRSSINLI